MTEMMASKKAQREMRMNELGKVWVTGRLLYAMGLDRSELSVEISVSVSDDWHTVGWFDGRTGCRTRSFSERLVTVGRLRSSDSRPPFLCLESDESELRRDLRIADASISSAYWEAMRF